MTNNKKFFEIEETIFTNCGRRSWRVNGEPCSHMDYTKFRTKIVTESMKIVFYAGASDLYSNIVIHESGYYDDATVEPTLWPFSVNADGKIVRKKK